MGHRLLRVRVGRWPCGLLGMIGLIGAVEASIASHDGDFTSVWIAAWKHRGDVIRRVAARSEILAFGDSCLMQGFAPTVVEGRLGLDVYNLAVFNGQGPTSYFLLRRALEAGARPSAVLIDGEALEEDPRNFERRWAELLEFPEIWDFSRTAHDARLLAALTLGRLLPSVRARFEIREGVRCALRGEPAKSSAVPVHERNWEVNRGAEIAPESQSAAGLGEAIARSNYLPGEWSCHPINAVYIKRFLTLAAAHDIPVFWLLPPLHPAVHERRERGGMHGRFVRWVRSVQGRFPNMVVVDGRDAHYDPSALADVTHLNARGARVFSEEVAEILRDYALPHHASRPRWIRLPEYRDRRAEQPLEDLRRSEAALAGRPESRVRR